MITVQLAVLKQGEYAGAVGVYLAGSRAGSIPATHAAAYRAVVGVLTEHGHAATCRAALLGIESLDSDRQSRTHSEGRVTFGLATLQPAQPAAAPPGAPFLPPAVGARVLVDEETAVRLDATLPTRAKRFVDRRVGVLAPDATLLLDGKPVGRLEPDDRVLAPVRVAHAARFPLTCAVRLIREPARPLRVTADLPLGLW